MLAWALSKAMLDEWKARCSALQNYPKEAFIKTIFLSSNILQEN